MKKNIVLSFDDGRKDFYEFAFPILSKYNLKATLNVTTGYVDGSFNPNWKTSYGGISQEDASELKKNNIEIAYHGDMHKTEKEDFKNSIKKMKKWGLHSQEMGFAVPGSYLEKVNVNEFKTFLKDKNVIYMRVGDSKRCSFFINRVYRKLYNVFDLQLFYNLYNKNNVFGKDFNEYFLPSIAVYKKDNYKTLIRFIKQTKSPNIIFMLHGILPQNHENYGQDEYAWDLNNFEMFCKKLKELINNDQIDVITNIELVRRYK